MKSEMIELRNENRRINEKLDGHNSTIIKLSEELKSVQKDNNNNQSKSMDLISFQSMKNEIMELRNENQSIVDKLNIAQRSIDSQNSTIISLSEELKTVKKEMCIFAKQKQQIDSILETLQSSGQYNQMINNINSIDTRNSNDSYRNNDSRNTVINDENDFENILDNVAVIQNPILKTEIQDENEDISTFNENDDNCYYNDFINMTDTMKNEENVLNDIADNSLSNEITIKTEPENQNDKNIEGHLEKDSNLIVEVENSMHFINESEYQGSIESLNLQTSNLITQTNVDSDQRKFKCNICVKTFTQSCNLTMHLRVHTGESEKGSLKCHLCLKSYTTTSNLNVHLRTHTGERPFKCSQCQKTFTTSTSLIQHLRKHTGEKAFKCGECQKTFANSHNLKEHLKVHTGERLFKCSQCQKTYTQSGSFYRHLKTHD